MDAGLSQTGETGKPPVADPLREGPDASKRKRKTGERGPDKGPRKSKEQREREDRARDKAEREPIAAAWAEDIKELVAWPFEVAAERRGKHWILSEKERDKFALALSRVGVKYFPWLLEKFGEELALGICFCTLLFVRLKTDAANIAKAKAVQVDDVTGKGDETPRTPDQA